jgi:hypothetical protein
MPVARVRHRAQSGWSSDGLNVAIERGRTGIGYTASTPAFHAEGHRHNRIEHVQQIDSGLLLPIDGVSVVAIASSARAAMAS